VTIADKLHRAYQCALVLKLALDEVALTNESAKNIAELFGRDVQRLQDSIGSKDPDKISMGLNFSSLDARAADYLGGFEVWTHEETKQKYQALNAALLEAYSELD
jgi:predicted transcriptional regulator YdeE